VKFSCPIGLEACIGSLGEPVFAECSDCEWAAGLADRVRAAIGSERWNETVALRRPSKRRPDEPPVRKTCAYCRQSYEVHGSGVYDDCGDCQLNDEQAREYIRDHLTAIGAKALLRLAPGSAVPFTVRVEWDGPPR
jgi:hypothetical protein